MTLVMRVKGFDHEWELNLSCLPRIGDHIMGQDGGWFIVVAVVHTHCLRKGHFINPGIIVDGANDPNEVIK